MKLTLSDLNNAASRRDSCKEPHVGRQQKGHIES